ncbi:MAG: efflux transporter outer membrane subunit [Akkermansia sp.]|nr:efflux transporter outer membrane subunit [Akkermansia sp.]
MNKTAILILAGAAAFTTACTFGPMWTKPEMPVPAEFRGNGIGGSSMAELPWQSVIRDSNLQNLLNDVFENNRSLESLSHNVDAARQYVTIARAPMFPWLGYSASTSKGMNQSGGAGVAQMGGVTTNPGSIAASASWEIDLWGKTRKGVESAEASAEEAQEQLNALRSSLLCQVSTGYLQLLMLDEQLRIARSSVESYRESLQLFQDQQSAGVADRLQTASAEAALAAAEAEIPSLEMQIAELENTLSALAGRMPGHIKRGGSLLGFANASTVSAGIPADVLARRPDIRSKEQAMRSANAEVGVAIASYFPSISLTGTAGVASADLRHAIHGHRTGWGIGASLTGPLFQAGQLKANELAKRDAFLAAKADYENTVLSAMSEISTTLIQRTKLRDIMRKQEAAVAAYQESVKLSKARYTQGLSSYYEVLNAQLLLFPAQKQLASYRYQYAACIPTLYTQLGGGWQ